MHTTTSSADESIWVSNAYGNALVFIDEEETLTGTLIELEGSVRLSTEEKSIN